MDINTLAKSVVDQAIGEKAPVKNSVDPQHRKRGLRRAELLTPERKSEIAKKAAVARWDKSKT